MHFFTLKNQQVADGGGSPVPPVQVDYHGGVAFDPRDSRGMDMSLIFLGSQVRGMIRVPADCTSTGILVGGDLSIQAVLSGPWEGRASVIEGTWGGTTLPCGAMQTIADRGTLRIVIDKRPDGSPGVVVNLVDDDTGPPGTFFTFAPYGKEFVAGQGTGPGVAMNYQDGRSWDPRDPSGQTMPLSLAGDKVSGTIKSAGTCDFANGLFFPSVDISIEAALRGPWEEQGSIMHGSWGGNVTGCASPPNNPPVIQRGEICVFMGPGPNGELTTLTRIAAGGSFRDYFYRPLGQSFGTGIAPGNIGLPETVLTYPDGTAFADGRKQRLEIAFQGSRVHGSFHVEPVCVGNTMSLAGGDAFFEGTLNGDWENASTTITGLWGGNARFCDGSTKPDFGMIQITLQPLPSGGTSQVIVQLAGLQGLPYAYVHAPLGTVATAFGGAAMVPDTLFGNAITNCMIPLVGDLGALAVGPPTLQQPTGQTGPRNPGARASRIVVLDASGSMGDEGKMDEAKASAREVFGQMRGDTEVALIAFFDCSDIRVVQPFTIDPAPLLAALEPIMPSGGTPLGESAGFAAKYMEDNASSTDREVTTLTDGQESCGGDLKGTAEKMVNP